MGGGSCHGFHIGRNIANWATCYKAAGGQIIGSGDCWRILGLLSKLLKDKKVR